MTREDLMEKGKCKKNHCSAVSNSASFELNSKGDILKLHDLCNNPKDECQKQNISHQTIFKWKEDQLEIN